MFLERIKKLTRNLYPRGRAFKMPYGGVFDKLHNALSVSENEALQSAVSILDSILPDNDNFTALDAADWERRLGLITNESLSLEIRKAAIRRKMNHPGTISARQHYLYLQGQLQAAGFDLYVFENRFPDYPDGYYTIDPVSLFPIYIEYIANGTFDEVTPWTLSGTGISITGGELTFVSASNGAYAQQLMIDIIPYDTGTYEASIRIGTLTSISFNLYASDGTTLIFGQGISSPSGVFTFNIDSSTFGGEDAYYARIVIDTVGGSDTGIIDDVSIRKVFDLADYPGLVDIGYGEYAYQNIVANYLEQEKDASFDVGDNFRSTFFVGGTPLGTFADVEESRVEELRQLILKLKPAQTVAYLITREVY